jgi:putative flavoprotein involved in K+ transport
MPRRYRGLDIYWWLESTGRLARTIDEMRDPVAARREPSLQLVGRNDPERSAPDLDLALLQSRGVRLTGRLQWVHGGKAEFGDELPMNLAHADATMQRFLDRVDGFVERAGLTDEVWPGSRPEPVHTAHAPSRLHLRAERIGTILLATGFRPHHPWLQLRIKTRDGGIRQYRGSTAAPGVYTVGQRFQHRRDAGLIDGARHDAGMVVAQLLGRSVRSLSPMEAW